MAACSGCATPSAMHMDFYRKAKAMSASDVQALCKRHATHQLSQEWGWAEEGAFKPLGVWAIEGWDVGAIKEKAQPDGMRDLVKDVLLKVFVSSDAWLQS